MKILMLYGKKSCKTGRLLKELLDQRPGVKCLRKISQRPQKADVTLRWGDTQTYNVTSKFEINSRESVGNTANKLRMLQILKAADIPVVDFTTNFNELNDYLDGENGFYVRNKLGQTRYDNTTTNNDLYVCKSVPNKRREYRVHVFNGKVISIYEKIPKDPKQKLYKSDNCKFSLVDPEVSRCDRDGQSLCVKAVAALGLTSGGVDIIRSKRGEFTICEVNSSPGLNTTNADRWVDEIIKFIEERNNNP